MKVLVVNAGSSSLKYQLFDTAADTVLAKGICEGAGIAYVPKKPYDEFADARSAAMDKDVMRGNGKDDYWTTAPTRQELAVILRRAGVI